MNAIFKGKLYRLGDNLNVALLIDDVEAEGTGEMMPVSYGSPDLIIDPTDDQINNLLPDAD